MENLKKLLLSFLILLIAAGTVPAQKKAKTDKPQKKIQVGLVLCGGGAKGAAHIGAIKKLEEVGIRPDLIVGTSMGALIGGLYAMGYSSSQMDTIISNADWDYLLSDNIKREDMNFSVKQEDDKYFISIPFSSLAIENLTSKKKEEKKG
ncbi:MAG: patatin-like phospholipase family protein, partial [Bacteroidales bacterium]|nr:patatin-like phospholipase family protein [Bacteroidales bacterium]